MIDTTNSGAFGCATGFIRFETVTLSRRLFTRLRQLATPNYYRHAPNGQGLTGLCRFPVTRLSFELLRPTSLKSIHDVARQVRYSHAGKPCETDRPVTRAARGTLGSVLGRPRLLNAQRASKVHSKRWKSSIMLEDYRAPRAAAHE
jgi:hypothetical protein